MKQKQIFFLHLSYWLLVIFNGLISIIVYDKEGISILNVTIFLANLLGFYANYFFVVPRFFNPKKFYMMIIGFFIGVFVFVFFRYSMEEILLPALTGRRNYAEGTTFLYYFYDNIYYSSLTVFVSTNLWFFKYYFKIEAERSKLIEERKHAQLQALKTQINPHFIFNSLNNIYSLVYQNSDKALPAIEKLGELLRYSTKDLEKDVISLDKEIGYIESLIELEKLRIKNPELLVLEKNIQDPKINISPMLLVPFVENAFKHGDFREKGFVLKVSEDDQRIHFYLQNFKSRREKDAASGIGIGNVQKRLEILYPKKHELNIKETESEFVVDLTIDLSS
ncbi:sensor histidine kinase [Chryseobacterium sp. W4I1]|uniref:sensor histidine kinase n=1 Tax=Chryseobacterium sp. W4I1 TaxID=3042293 RepID=UPI00277DDBDD|nr:histidine kinase [Chryseobacterium sp. W4I1]MDQ0783572.1 two-component system LytT family sensor kinase [Chryseobacterium sp. W4I1]